MFPNTTGPAALKPAICQANGGFREKHAKRASLGEVERLMGARPQTLASAAIGYAPA